MRLGQVDDRSTAGRLGVRAWYAERRAIGLKSSLIEPTRAKRARAPGWPLSMDGNVLTMTVDRVDMAPERAVAPTSKIANARALLSWGCGCLLTGAIIGLVC